MGDEPGNTNGGEPGRQDAGDGHGEDFGEVSFFRVSSGTRNGLPYLSSLGFGFDDGQPDPDAGKRAFDAAIRALDASLRSYRAVLETREVDFDSALTREPGDAGLLASSDTVQEALDSLALAHQAWTGHPFPEGPLYRRGHTGPQDPEEWDRMFEADELAREQDAEDTGPPIGELGATVILDRLLHHSAREVLHLGTATVHRNGVLLAVDYLNLRGAGEGAASWYRRSHEHLGNVELGLELHDPATGTGYPGQLQGGDGRIERNCYRLAHRFWIHRGLDADELTGTFTVSEVLTAEGNIEPLAVEFGLPTRELRAAAAAGIRSFGNHLPGS